MDLDVLASAAVHSVGIVATTAVVIQTTSYESAGCGTGTGRLEAGSRPTQHGVGVLLLQISWCRPSKQHRPDSTVFLYARALVVQQMH